jgi:hypothetical protein
MYARLYHLADTANKQISGIVNHPFSGWVSLFVILGWFAASRIASHFDPDLTFLSAGTNSLQTYLLFVIAAATATNAANALVHAHRAHERAHEAHAHAQAAHDRLDQE